MRIGDEVYWVDVAYDCRFSCFDSLHNDTRPVSAIVRHGTVVSIGNEKSAVLVNGLFRSKIVLIETGKLVDCPVDIKLISAEESRSANAS